ncbi:MAG: alpha/beta hydrolase [Syntrophus sp. (in: bacteria)]|nr:alpha/beta hydrolase [Syntrophus sp. (in: bacteria)]
MSIKRVTIPSVHMLEALLREGGKNAGVVICHPHPLYGGDMYSNVVEAIETGFSAISFTTLRFNFRGVGGSGGFYDEGEGEVDDLLAALRFLKGSLNRDAYVILAGYSFGAWICSKAACKGGNIDGLFIVAYPFSVYKTDELSTFRGTICFVGGSFDEIGPMDALLDFYTNLPLVDKHLKIIPTSHFFPGKEAEIIDFIKERADSLSHTGSAPKKE